MRKTIVALFFSLYLVGCGVNFDNYMPNDQATLKFFPPELVGNYRFTDSVFGEKTDEPFFNEAYFSNALNAHDSLTLVSGNLAISQKIAAYHFSFKAYYNTSKVDTGRLIERFKKEKRYRDGKYIVFVATEGDTILNLRSKDKLTSLNGKFYLNHFVKKKNWEIYQFENIKGSVYSVNITNDADRNQLTDTTQVWKDIFPVVHLSNLQFKNFVDSGGFRAKFGFTKSN